DFSDEDLTYETREVRVKKVRDLLSEIDAIMNQSRITSRLAEGVQVALGGVPNAGKSSLLNRILGWDRAIVSAVPGTTRDFVAEEFQIDGISVRLVDTAGMRETLDEVEREGVHRSRKEIGRSQIVLHVVDGSVPAYAEPDFRAQGTIIEVVNKKDILHPSRREGLGVPAGSVLVSCATGEGLDDLHARIHQEIFSGAGSADGLLLEDRQRFHFLRTGEALRRVLELWDERAPDEVTAIELDRALHHCGEITGQITNEEVLGRIFSMFCIGK
ncbi:MAG: 50S ribosome-binding GTPase, partial [Spirochaetia bacterium]|nr:50S ribosome-binding GTPase [Spirochaetia bacterium]